mmetsp:Transcript_9003/g.13301  ORF Transcript_9003/g.13301 Transcript_9003/m.13301 type:complete len:131 (-) Transcript_9003:180-572(-)
MATRLLSILRMVFPRGATYGPRANGWAEISLWRKFFHEQELKEEEEEMEDHENNYFSECIRRQRQGHNIDIDGREVVREHYRSLREPQEDAFTTTTSDSPSASETFANQQLNRPNLDVPMEDGSYVTLAQ